MATRWALDRVRALDADDGLADLRNHFVLPEDVIYLDGNSLGALAPAVADRLRRVVECEWGRDLSAGWTDRGWMEAPVVVGDRIAPLIGAKSGEVLVADTTSVVLTKLLIAALQTAPARRVILSSNDNFPSDLYAAAGAARLVGAELRVVQRDDILPALNDEIAVCCLTHVDFRTGALYDIPSVTSAVHEAGALALWDLCHSAGAMPVGCAAHEIDLAVGCTYKYLNGGPGSPSFLYVRTELQDQLTNPLPGWLGHDEPFGFGLEWRPAGGIRRFLTSTPPVIALAALDAALDAFDGVSIHDVREKSKALGQLFIEVVQDADVPHLQVASPISPDARGSQVTLRHRYASELVEAAISRGVVGDFRPPDFCRFGLSPLYLSFEEVYRAATIVVDCARS